MPVKEAKRAVKCKIFCVVGEDISDASSRITEFLSQNGRRIQSILQSSASVDRLVECLPILKDISSHITIFYTEE